MTLIRITLAGAFLFATGCDLEDPLGSEELGQDIQDEATSLTNDQPCGAATVTQFPTDAGTRITLCVFDDGTEAILEAGKLGQPSAIHNLRDACALDIFLALAPPELPVPRSLQGSCQQGSGTHEFDADDIVLSATDERDFKGPFVPKAQYCGAGGDARFRTERCGDIKSQCSSAGGCEFYRCIITRVASHQLTCSASVNGNDCAFGIDQLAACSGTVRHQGWRDGNFSGPPSFTQDVLANEWHGIFYKGPQRNMRFRGDKVSGNASHYYVTGFKD